MGNKDYIQKINDIVWQKAQTLEDIHELSVILIQLSIKQKEYMIKASELEHEYKTIKSKIIVDKLSVWSPYNRAEVMASDKVEWEYWDYRIYREKWKSLDSICRRVEWFIKLFMHKNKIDKMLSDASFEF